MKKLIVLFIFIFCAALCCSQTHYDTITLNSIDTVQFEVENPLSSVTVTKEAYNIHYIEYCYFNQEDSFYLVGEWKKLAYIIGTNPDKDDDKYYVTFVNAEHAEILLSTHFYNPYDALIFVNEIVIKIHDLNKY